MKTETQPTAPNESSRRGNWLVRLVKAHPRITAAVLIAGVALGIFGFLWFRPDKLFVDTKVNEGLPDAPAAQTGPANPAQPASSQILSTGEFRNLEHETKGQAKIVRLADGRTFVRLENFRTSSGPDVVVILSDTPATEDSWGAYDDGTFVSIGALRGNVGNQNYLIPASTDLGKYRSIVIWCRRFNVAFGAAPMKLA